MGAVSPSSSALGNLMSKHVPVEKDAIVVELGGGTGKLTRALLDTGVLPQNLYVIELNPKFVKFLSEKFPESHIIQGDVTNLNLILPKELVGKVSSIVSGIPMINIKRAVQKEIMDASFNCLKKSGRFLQFTYGLKPPIPTIDFNLRATRVGSVVVNLPPASVWSYRRA